MRRTRRGSTSCHLCQTDRCRLLTPHLSTCCPQELGTRSHDVPPVRHDLRVRRAWVILIVGLAAAGCTSSGGSKSSPPSVSSDPSTPASSSAVTSTAPPSPTVSPTPTRTAPATPTVPPDVPTTGPNMKPGEKPPVMPLVATTHTPAGAKAFAEFFIRTIDWAYATNSAKYMRHYYEASCIECRSAADAVDKAVREGHHFIGDRFTIRRSAVLNSSNASTVVDVYFDVSAAEVVDGKGRFVDGLGALNNYRERITTAWRPSGWMVTDMLPKAGS